MSDELIPFFFFVGLGLCAVVLIGLWIDPALAQSLSFKVAASMTLPTFLISFVRALWSWTR